jgi:hypothetical protein
MPLEPLGRWGVKRDSKVLEQPVDRWYVGAAREVWWLDAPTAVPAVLQARGREAALFPTGLCWRA